MLFWFRSNLARLGVVLLALLTLVAASGCVPGSGGALRQSTEAGIYWCPMHPEIRGPAGSRCPRCGMTLVRAAPSDYQPYVMDVETVPRALQPGQPGRLLLRVRDPRSNTVVDRFDVLHERLFHLFVVSHDLEYFEHVHPTLGAGGVLELALQLPRPGPYRLIADFLPEGQAPQLLERTIVTVGYQGSLLDTVSPPPDAADKVVLGTRVKMFTPPPVAGREQLITFELSDDTTGRPVENLQPYLGATGHLLVLSADLSVSFHSHPVAEITSRFGPSIVFQMVFPRAGPYKLWVQFQRDGRVGTAAFTVPVSERH